MTTSKQAVIRDIRDHISKEGSGYSAWYVGISESPRDLLFNDHYHRRII